MNQDIITTLQNRQKEVQATLARRQTDLRNAQTDVDALIAEDASITDQISFIQNPVVIKAIESIEVTP